MMITWLAASNMEISGCRTMKGLRVLRLVAGVVVVLVVPYSTSCPAPSTKENLLETNSGDETCDYLERIDSEQLRVRLI